jgi:hypothetical protein
MADHISEFKTEFQKLLILPLTTAVIRQAVAEILGDQLELTTDDFKDGPLDID